MQHVLVLAEHTDHLLRFSFVASIRVERPSAGNDQKKMVGPRYGAPQSVCFLEIAGGLGLCTVRSCWSHARKNGSCECSQATLTHFNDSEFLLATWCLSVKGQWRCKAIVVYVCFCGLGWRVNVFDLHWKMGGISWAEGRIPQTASLSPCQPISR